LLTRRQRAGEQTGNPLPLAGANAGLQLCLCSYKTMHRSTDLNRALTANGRQRNGVSEYLQHLAAGAFLAGLLAGGAVQAHVTDPQPGGAPAVSETPPVPAQTAAGAADPAKVGGQRHRLTPEELHTAMLEAEQRRAAAMRPDPGVPKELAETWGVEVIRIDYSAGGYWLDFRFKVTDAKKALPLFDGRVQPYVDPEKGGAKLGCPSPPRSGPCAPPTGAAMSSPARSTRSSSPTPVPG
jgi:hypothetical protein